MNIGHRGLPRALAWDRVKAPRSPFEDRSSFYGKENLHATIALTLLPLAGCKSEVLALLRLRDIADAVVGHGPQPEATLQIALEVPSTKECEALVPQLLERAEPYGLTPQNIKCTSRRMDNFIQFRSTVPVIVQPANVRPQGNHLFAIAIRNAPSSKNQYFVTLIYNRAAFDRLQADLKNQNSMYGFGFDDMKLSLDLENDTRNEETVHTGSAFVDGSPVLFWNEFKLKPRQSIDVRYSDVAVADFGKSQSSNLVTVNFTSQ